jgi:hypothetical protein
MLPPNLHALLQAELQPGERLLWHGQPRPWHMILANISLVPFFMGWIFIAIPSVPLANGIIKKEYESLDLGKLGATLFLLVFITVGMFLMLTPFTTWCAARKTIYAITSKRALVIRLKRGGNLDVIVHSPEDLESISRKQRTDGSGSLYFYSFHEKQPISPNHAFCGIPGVRNVERILLAMRDENLRASNPTATS